MKNEMLITGGALAATKKWGALKMAVAIVAVAGMLLMMGCKKNDGLLEELNAGSGERSAGFTGTVFDKAFIHAQDTLYALAANTGDKLWAIKTINRESMPVVDHATNSVFQLQQDNCLHAYNFNTGAELWKYDFNSRNYDNRGVIPLCYDGYVYLQYYNYVYCINAISGTVKWSVRVYEGAGNVTAANGMIYFTTGDDYLHCVDAKSGLIKWLFHVTVPASSGANLNPAYANGAIFITYSDGFLYSINATTGKLNWKHQFGNSPERSSNPTVESGVVVIRKGQSLFGINQFTGVRKWEMRMQDDAYSNPVIRNGSVFIYDKTYVYNIDADRGTVKAVTPAKSIYPFSLTVGTVFGNQAVFVRGIEGSSQNYLYALNANDLTIIWKYYIGKGNEAYSPGVSESTATTSYHPGDSGAQQ